MSLIGHGEGGLIAPLVAADDSSLGGIVFMAARRVRVPVLILHGETDRQATAAQADELDAALRASGNQRVTVRVFPATNRLFLADSSGNWAG